MQTIESTTSSAPARRDFARREGESALQTAKPLAREMPLGSYHASSERQLARLASAVQSAPDTLPGRIERLLTTLNAVAGVAHRRSTTIAPQAPCDATAALPGDPPLVVFGPGGDFTTELHAAPCPTDLDTAARAAAEKNATAVDECVLDHEPRLTKRGSSWQNKNHYEWVTTEQPTLFALRHAQRRAGYDPDGYGGPFNVVTNPLPVRGYRTTWTSSGSCD